MSFFLSFFHINKKFIKNQTEVGHNTTLQKQLRARAEKKGGGDSTNAISAGANLIAIHAFETSTFLHVLEKAEKAAKHEGRGVNLTSTQCDGRGLDSLCALHFHGLDFGVGVGVGVGIGVGEGGDAMNLGMLHAHPVHRSRSRALGALTRFGNALRRLDVANGGGYIGVMEATSIRLSGADSASRSLDGSSLALDHGWREEKKERRSGRFFVAWVEGKKERANGTFCK